MNRFCLVAVLGLSLPVAAAAQTTTPAQPGTAKPATAKPGTGKPGTAKPATGAARTIEMAGGDDMKFNITELAAKRGETLRIVLKNVGTLPKMAMAHNVVVLKPTTKVVEFANAAAMARDTEFVPVAMKAEVVAATALAGPGETVEVTFKVPTTAGAYPFICSFPGHYTAGMKGTLAVK